MGDDKIRMTECRVRFDFPPKSLNHFRRSSTNRTQYLQANSSPHEIVASFVNLPHATLAELLDDDIVAKYQALPTSARKGSRLVGGQRVIIDQLFRE